jgi:osmotically-inducible protein OsmY
MKCEAEGNCGKETVGRQYWITWLSIAAGAVFGATVMYFCDPHRGKSRRTRLQEKAASAAKRGGHELAKKAEDVLNRAKGAVAEARAAFERGEEVVDDDIVAERVRSHMGHVTEHAGGIQTEVANGVVTLRGTVSRERKRSLVDEILAVPGVTGVRDLLVGETLQAQ